MRDQENFTDPDSRIMPTAGNSFEQSYNAQTAVDEAEQIVSPAMDTQNSRDMGELVPVIDAACGNTSTRPRPVLADAGYKVERDLQMLEQLGIDGYVSIGREGKASKRPGTKCPSACALQRKLATKRGRARYRRARQPVFGWMKRVLGFRPFSMRGLRKVAGEWSIVCMALNLRRMAVKGVGW